MTESRWYGRLCHSDIERLLHLEREWRTYLEENEEGWAIYGKRLICICLCQGAALHLVDGRNGVKDFDVWRFFAALSPPPRRPGIYRRHTHVDFGPSRIGRRTDAFAARRWPSFSGRNVDIRSAALPVAPGSEPVSAIREWLTLARTRTARHLARKAVVVLSPPPVRIAWPAVDRDEQLVGFDVLRSEE